jgi:hypothetical protein
MDKQAKPTTSEARSTPTPWNSSEFDDGVWQVNATEEVQTAGVNGGFKILNAYGPQAKANAEIIVRAVNSREELVGLLQYVDWANAENIARLDDGELVSVAVTVKFLRDLKAALAKAEGK